MRPSHAYDSSSHSAPLSAASVITTAPTAADYLANQQQVAQLLAQLNQVVLDKPRVVKLALSCVLAGGQLLLQDLAGMGKTT